MIEWISDNWGLLIAISAAIDALAGFLPDKYLAYIGVIRRIVGVLKKTPKAMILFLLVFIVSCGTMQQPPSICDNLQPGESVLCDLAKQAGVQLEFIGDVLMVVNLRAIKEGLYTASQARDAIQNVINTVALDGATTAQVRAIILENAAEYPELLLASRYLTLLDAPAILKPFDKNTVLGWCYEQLEIIK